jgi:4-hydroxybutyrate dehydrogenase/sulfolactaldehyde 3-reductase
MTATAPPPPRKNLQPQPPGPARGIGFVGLGRMGFALARSLAQKGHDPAVHDIAAERMAALAPLGARPMPDAAAVAAGADILFLMLPGPAEVRQVALGPAGVLDRMAPGAVLVDLSTVDVETTDLLAAAAAARGIGFADAPVGRLAAHADRGESLFMAGADPAVLDRIRPALMAMGTSVLHCGPAGHGTRSKLVNNFMVLCYCQINSEALVLAQALGLDLGRSMEVLLGTTAANGQLRDKWPVKVLAGDLTPGFALRLGLKDLSLACDAARQGGVALPAGHAVREMFRLALSAGYGDMDTSAMTDFWASANGQPPPRLPRGQDAEAT